MAAPREPQDRKAPARKRATKTVQRKPTAAEMAASEADETTGLRTEVEVEETGRVEVPWNGRIFHILPGQEWRQTANDAINEGRFNDWAGEVMLDDDYEAFLDINPTNREFGEFMAAMGEEVGASLGESGASNRALRRMRRR